jgi:hypothetical protein
MSHAQAGRQNAPSPMTAFLSPFFRKEKKQGEVSPCFLFRYFLTFVMSAASANAVSDFVLATIVAFDHAWNL